MHARVRDYRRDGLHKLTTELTRTKSLIVVEDFQTKALSRNRSVAGSLWDAAPSEFLRQLSYKSKWSGGSILVAPLFFPSSKLCSRCGWLAFTMISEARVYCDVCDEVRPALLHEYRPAGLLSGGLVRCAVCYASRARLYGTKVSAR